MHGTSGLPFAYAVLLASAFLAALVIGSGSATQRLSDDTGLQLPENTTATAAGRFAMILVRVRLRSVLQPGRLPASTPPSAASRGATPRDFRELTDTGSRER
jgi:hypothetical protein